MNTFEITHSRTAGEIAKLVEQLRTRADNIVDHAYTHRARLVKPLLAFDTSGVALTFLPAAGESSAWARAMSHQDEYTYDHLRRDLHSLCADAVDISQRYTLPSAHLTIARFVVQDDFVNPNATGELEAARIERWIAGVNEVNLWLSQRYWSNQENRGQVGMEWFIGEEQGLEYRSGALWYGGGETIRLGKGYQVGEPIGSSAT